MCSSSSKTDASPLPETVLVGRILRAHGVRGEVLVEVLSDNPRRFAAGSELLAARAGRARGKLTIRAAHPHPAGLRIAFAELGDRDTAAALAGAELEAERASVPAAAPGAYYLFELVGCRCRDRVAGELGEVTDAFEDGGGWLLEVTRDDRRLLVPFVASFVAHVDRQERTIQLDLPEGLIEACTSRS
jgi:16S rRNA processing protein RimM